MRNQVSMIALFATVVACPILALGQTSAPSPAGKVAVINMQAAIVNCAEGKKAFTDLQAKYRPQQQEIDRRTQEVSALEDQLQKQATTLSDDEQVRLNRELADKQKILKRMTEDAQSNFQDDRQDIVSRIGKKMVQVIDQYAQQHGYDLVIDASQFPIYYTAKGVDITQDIIKQYDAQYPVQAAAAGPPAKPADQKPKQP